MRGIIHCLLEGLLGEGQVLAKIPRQTLSGIGLSDWDGYAKRLAAKFDYANTYFHQEPRLDICAPDTRWLYRHDFLISTDVFEHTPPPAARAFEGAWNVLKPGGLLVMTVPFADNRETVEHYPQARQFKVLEIGGDYAMVARDDTGALSLHTDLVFHGGPGTTLEMRLFSRDDIVRQLSAVGFTDIRVHDKKISKWGILPFNDHGCPITARKPADAVDDLVALPRRRGLFR